MEKVTLNVSGMSCGHCEKAVKGALMELAGVTNVVVHLSTGKVDVEFEPSKVSIDQLKEAIEEQGYDVA
ncbi:copper chaperone [Anoxybacillus calidus]|jgi:copper chaperone|uniref:Copper chaperone CopZ n=1 Tax=[Anoxybacillus] calidus TaxID=575178 RepID=A0A7V9YXM4_9BACL|nr:copper chaperone CopZ [Anoxybacillus calidus]MBA2870331.1 copper chaperone [Anoxybacillus calidus]